MSRKEEIGRRLAAERNRLGCTQDDFAALAGVTRKTVYGYETGARAPDGEAMAIWSDRGVDALFVITGRREGISESLLAAVDASLTKHGMTLQPAGKIAIYNRAIEAVRKGVPEAKAASDEVGYIVAAISDPAWLQDIATKASSAPQPEKPGKVSVRATGGSIAAGGNVIGSSTSDTSTGRRRK